MKPGDSPQTLKHRDSRSYKPMDRVAYAGLGAYSLITIAWILWALTIARFGIFDTAIWIGIVLPVIAILISILFQCASRQNRFSVLANVLSIYVISGWILMVWSIIVAASASV